MKIKNYFFVIAFLVIVSIVKTNIAYAHLYDFGDGSYIDSTLSSVQSATGVYASNYSNASSFMSALASWYRSTHSSESLSILTDAYGNIYQITCSNSVTITAGSNSCPNGGTMVGGTPAIKSSEQVCLNSGGEAQEAIPSCGPIDTYTCPTGYSSANYATTGSSPFTCYPNTNRCNGCANGATNPPTCSCTEGSTSCCHAGQVFSGGKCQTSCSNGAVNPDVCNQCALGSTFKTDKCICNNLAGNSPICNICPASLAMTPDNLCQCANGTINPTPTGAVPTICTICPVSATMTNGQCSCANGATPLSNCTQCPAGKVMYQNQCVQGSIQTNICGQKINGVTISGIFHTIDGTDPNASCISNFTVSSNTVNPNGSVDFSWQLADLTGTGIGSRCGFVDLTTPTPRPIPGLQNLDPSRDTARISNIQSTTRFCLICQFYNLLSNADLGNVAVHQWVRVIRIGEQ